MEIMEQKMQEQIEGAIMKDSAGICETCNGDGYLVEVYTHPECCGNSETGECGGPACNGPQPVEEPTQVECQNCYGSGAKAGSLDWIIAKSLKGLDASSDALLVARVALRDARNEIKRLQELKQNLEAFAQFIIDGYANHDLNHVDFRVGAYKNALHALDQEAPEEKMALDLGLLPETDQ